MKHGSNWLSSVSDMMSGLMMIFLLITVVFLIDARHNKERLESEKQAAVTSATLADDAKRQADDAKKEAQQRAATYLQQGETIRQIAATYTELQIGLYQDLEKEFRNDLPRWNATLERDNTIRFNEPEVLFEAGKSVLREKFKTILGDFFPRYIRILTSPKYAENIDEVRVEGHTSTEWEHAVSLPERYLNNARLSQERALAVVQYAFMLESTSPQRDWLIRGLRANGLSFARPILSTQGAEDKGRSRRVEFRVFTKTKEQILRIIEVSEAQKKETEKQ